MMLAQGQPMVARLLRAASGLDGTRGLAPRARADDDRHRNTSTSGLQIGAGARGKFSFRRVYEVSGAAAEMSAGVWSRAVPRSILPQIPTGSPRASRQSLRRTRSLRVLGSTHALGLNISFRMARVRAGVHHCAGKWTTIAPPSAGVGARARGRWRRPGYVVSRSMDDSCERGAPRHVL
jgi:hypothetical protein